MVEIVRRGQDDLVARIRDGEQRIDEGHVAPRGHDYPGPRANSQVIFQCQLCLDGGEERGDPGDGLVFVIGRVGEKHRDLIQCRLGRSVVHHTLAEGNRARTTPDQIGDDGNDGSLHRAQAEGFVHERSFGSAAAGCERARDEGNGVITPGGMSYLPHFG